MRVTDVETGRIYLAYCGSLAPVRVVETGVHYWYEGAAAPSRNGVRVRAIHDIPLASDWPEAWRENRAPVLAHETGDLFVIPARELQYEAGLDVRVPA